jgi:hypothetical protein
VQSCKWLQKFWRKASIFSSPWKWKRYVPLRSSKPRRRPHGITTHETTIGILTARRHNPGDHNRHLERRENVSTGGSLNCVVITLQLSLTTAYKLKHLQEEWVIKLWFTLQFHRVTFLDENLVRRARGKAYLIHMTI